MARYIDKDALVVEIERRWKYDQGFSTEEETKAYQCCCDDILSFINTLEVKEVNLEKEINKYITKNLTGVNSIYTKGSVSCIIKNAAKHFFELGLKAQKG